MLTRHDLEKSEDKLLAGFAMKSKETRGRSYKEEEHPYRTVYQRDRDRVVHSTAFRRLEYKTQVFVNHEGDYYRTRLTHTIEVAQIARSISRALGLNEDLCEAIALSHDIGHTPFGHSGEEALADLMKNHGGFNHNHQGLRIVDYLEERYPQFKGLNLTYEVRQGIIKHSSTFDKAVNLSEFGPKESPLLEVQVVDIADEIAYDNHDLDDGITSGLVSEAELRKIELWDSVSFKTAQFDKGSSDEIRKYQIIRSLINLHITDLINESGKRIDAMNIKTSNDALACKERIICFSDELQEKRKPLKEFLSKNLYQHYRVIRMANKANRFLKDIFNVYLAKPEQLPPTSLGRIKIDGVHRAVCDYIAGMTDRYAQDEYNKLFIPYERV